MLSNGKRIMRAYYHIMVICYCKFFAFLLDFDYIRHVKSIQALCALDIGGLQNRKRSKAMRTNEKYKKEKTAEILKAIRGDIEKGFDFAIRAYIANCDDLGKRGDAIYEVMKDIYAVKSKIDALIRKNE